jgi:peptide/nickel transport system ATP-binding protein
LSNMPLLEVHDLTVEYHTDDGVFRAVEGLNFNLDQGRSLGIVGESGCGKTTAMLALMRLLPEAGRIVEGEVILDGVDLLSLSKKELRNYRWARISMIFQSAMNALNPVYTVGKQIEDTLLLHNTASKKNTKKAVAQLLDLVGVSSSRASQYPHEYSGGMRQRAMIAMALACNPQIVIADEPTTALDVMVQAQILDLLKELQRELNLSIILVTHDLGVVAEICDDVLVMYGGQLAEYADIDRIYNHAVHPYTRRLLVAFPDIQNPDAELTSIPGYPPPLDNLPPGCRFAPRCDVSIENCSRINPPEIEVSQGHLARCILVKNHRAIGKVGE